MNPTLDDFARQITGKTCRWCRAKLPAKVESYNHSGGVLIAGFEMRQWLYVTCPKCEYQWALWKLKISKTRLVDPMELEQDYEDTPL